MHGCSVVLTAHVYRVSFLEDDPVVNETSGSVGQLGRQWGTGGERERDTIMDTWHPTCAYSGPHMINSYIICIACHAKSVLHNNYYLVRMLGLGTFFCAVRAC